MYKLEYVLSYEPDRVVVRTYPTMAELIADLHNLPNTIRITVTRIKNVLR